MKRMGVMLPYGSAQNVSNDWRNKFKRNNTIRRTDVGKSLLFEVFLYTNSKQIR